MVELAAHNGLVVGSSPAGRANDLVLMVDVAQLVESRIVIPAVAGSNPVVHPTFYVGR